MRVPRFEPFPALRYAPAIALDDAAAPPYDVLSAADVAALRARHDRNIVEIDVPGPDDDIGRYDLDPQGHCPHCQTAIAGRFGPILGHDGRAFGPRRIPVRLWL